MQKLIINGAKNSILPIISATLLEKKIYYIKNVPKIEDVYTMIEILKQFNVYVSFFNNDSLFINTKNIVIPKKINYNKNCRASYYFIGATAKYNSEIEFETNIGCKIGKRSIHYHIELLTILGKKLIINQNKIQIYGNCNQENVNYYFKTPSVGATINGLLMFCKLNSKTTFYNYAKDPYIIDVIDFLKKIGCCINYDNEKIQINHHILEHEQVNLIYHNIIPDPIETITYLICSAINLSINSLSSYCIGPIILKNLGIFKDLLNKIGIYIIETSEKNYYQVYKQKIESFNVKTDYFPGIYTDVQPFLILLGLHTTDDGTCSINETIFENRFEYINEIEKLGFQNIEISNNTALIKNSSFQNNIIINKVKNYDLRSDMAILILMIKYNYNIELLDSKFIDRGYEDYFKKIEIIMRNNRVIILNKNLENLSNIRIGGRSKYYYEVKDREDLNFCLSFCRINNISYKIIGKGSNIFFDDYFEGMIITNNLEGIKFDEDHKLIEILSGTTLFDLVVFASKYGYDLSKLSGIPGSIAGGIYGNAGAYGLELKDIVNSCEVYDGKKIISLNNEFLQFGYRSSLFKKNKLNYIIISCVIKIPEYLSNISAINNKICNVLELRFNKFNLAKNIGSVFKNVFQNEKKKYAWELIKNSLISSNDLRNLTFNKNNFNILMNYSNATPSDLKETIQFIKEIVFKKFNILLEMEIEII